MKIKAAGFLSIIAMLAGTTGALAQASESNSSSGSQSNSRSQSNTSVGSGNQQGVRSTTNTGVTVDQRSYGTPYSSNYIGYGGGTNNTNTERSTGDVTIRTTPQVYAPPVSGGNPCTLAYSGGLSVIGWGAAAGGTVVDEDCATRQKIAMIHNSGRPDLAFALMCNDKATYLASKRTAAPCAFQPQFEAPGAQPTPRVAAPTPITAPAPMASVEPKNYPKCNPRAGIVDNCAM